MLHRRLLGGLQHDAVAGGKRRRELPHRHQYREVPRNDLPDDAERLMEVIGDGVVIDLGERAFLGADAAGEIAEVVDGERHVGVLSSRGSACRCRWSRRAPGCRGSPPSGRRSCSGRERARRPRSCPRRSCALCAASSASSMSSAVERAISQTGWPVIGVGLAKYWPCHRGDPFAADEIVVARLDNLPAFQLIHSYMLHGVTPPEKACWGLVFS